MSLVAFNGSIANPAQSAVNLGGNNLTNVNDAEATTLSVINAADLQRLSFKNTGSHGATGSISYVPSDVRFTCDQNFDIDGTCSVGGAFQALDTLSAGGLASFNANISLANNGADTPIISMTNGSTGASQCAISYNVVDSVLVVDKRFQIKQDAATSILSFETTANFPANMSYNYTDGFKIGTEFGNSTYVFGATGATAGATGAIPYLKVSGASGESRVYDPVYNPVPTESAYGQFSLNATVGVGGTGGTAGAADTAAQLSLDTADTAVGCSLSSGGILVNSTGKYLITVSPQFYNTGSGNHNVYFWFRVNSTNVAASSTGIYLVGNQAQQVPTVSIVLNLTANDVVKVMAASDDNEIQVLNVAAISTPYVRPAAPAIIATIVRVA